MIDHNGLRNLRLCKPRRTGHRTPSWKKSGRNRTKSACWSEDALQRIPARRMFMLDCDSGRWHGRVGHWPASKRNAHSFSALPLAALVTSPYTPGAPLARWRLLQALRLRILRRAASRQPSAPLTLDPGLPYPAEGIGLESGSRSILSCITPTQLSLLA